MQKILKILMSGGIEETTPFRAWWLLKHPKNEHLQHTSPFKERWRIVFLIFLLSTITLLASAFAIAPNDIVKRMLLETGQKSAAEGGVIGLVSGAGTELFCTDSDGMNKTTKGKVEYNLGSFRDGCFNATSVAEMYCNNSLPYVELKNCESACFEGACLPVPLPVCYDSDNRNHSEKGIARYFGEKENGLEYPDGCTGPDRAVEYFCEGGWVTPKEFPCEFGCFEGVCNPKPAPVCVDSDADEKHLDGYNPLLRGNTTYYGGTYKEICNNVSTAIETSCVNDVLKLDFIGCRLGCSNGVCIQNPPIIATQIQYVTLLGWYSFDEDNESFHGLDSSSFPIKLVPVGNGATVYVDENNAALYLDGTTYFELHPGKFPFPYLYPEIPKQNETTNYDFTFSAWFKTNKSSVVILGQTGKILPPNIPYKGTVTAVYIDKNGKLRTSVFWDGFPPERSDDERYVSKVAVNDSKWHNVVVAYGQGEERVYLDGELVNTRTFTQTGYAPEYTYTLGTGYSYQTSSTSAGWNNFEGYLDKILFFQQALSTSDIQKLYAEGRAGVAPLAPKPSAPVSSQPPAQPPSAGGGGGGGADVTAGVVGGGGGSSRALPRTHTINETQLFQGYSLLLKEGERVIFSIESEKHTLTLLKLNKEQQEGYIEISSTPQYTFLKVNTTEKFSLSNDTFYDLALTANALTTNALNLTLQGINESKLPPTLAPITGGAISETPSGKDNLLFWLGIALLIIIIYLIVIQYIKPKKK